MMPSPEAVAVEPASSERPPATFPELDVLAGYHDQLDSIAELELVDALAVLTEHHERLQAALSELDRT